MEGMFAGAGSAETAVIGTAALNLGWIKLQVKDKVKRHKHGDKCQEHNSNKAWAIHDMNMKLKTFF